MPVTATSKLSKKPKIIEIDLRSQKLRDTKRYRSQGGVPPNRFLLALSNLRSQLNYITATWESCSKNVKCLLLIRILTGPQNGPNPMVDIYPQMGSKHNINMIFERFSASRVGFKQIPMKNSYGNPFFFQKKMMCILE